MWHGSPIIMLGALLGVAAGGIAFLLDGNVMVALGAAALMLLVVAIIANRRTVEDRPPRREGSAAPASQPVETQTPLSRPTILAAVALGYVTLGAVLLIWTGVWWYYLEHHPPAHLGTWYVCYGLVGTGAVLVVLAPLIGPIGRSARRAELPPPEVTPGPAELAGGASSNMATSSGPRGSALQEPMARAHG